MKVRKNQLGVELPTKTLISQWSFSAFGSMDKTNANAIHMEQSLELQIRNICTRHDKKARNSVAPNCNNRSW